MSGEMAVPPAWRDALGEDAARVMGELDRRLGEDEAAGRVIYPDRGDRLRALELTPPGEVRVVLLGQDPYHGPGQAHGLSFSVRPGVRPPPSLANIYKELASDIGLARPGHGHLEAWARQGVLLLNTVLTVESGQAASHRGRGWEQVTDAVIRVVDAQPQPSVFLLWGAHAQRKAALVRDVTQGGRHLVLASAHPSPLSARTGFFGSRPFSRANTFLTLNGRGAIDWALPEEVA